RPLVVRRRALPPLPAAVARRFMKAFRVSGGKDSTAQLRQELPGKCKDLAGAPTPGMWDVTGCHLAEPQVAERLTDVRYWPHSRHEPLHRMSASRHGPLRNFAFAVAVGGKADMGWCGAHVCF